jgi:hypothetical protein
MRFEAKPGQRALCGADDECAVLMYDGVPDWVTVAPELGGGRAGVTSAEMTTCPCGGPGESLRLELSRELPDGRPLGVVECVHTNQYLWVALPAKAGS